MSQVSGARTTRLSSFTLQIGLVSCLLILTLGTSCRGETYLRPELFGDYELVYASRRIEHLTLRPDGTFIQCFEGSTHTGRWEYFADASRARVFLHKQRIFIGTWAMPAGQLHGNLLVRRTLRGPELTFNENIGWSYVRPTHRSHWVLDNT